MRAESAGRRPRPKVVLADGHRLFADGLEALLADEYEVIAIVGDGPALLDAVQSNAPSVVIADVSMPGLNGVECVRKLRETSPTIPVVLLTLHDDAHLAADALRAGAAGYLLKHGGADDVLAALRSALEGRVLVSPVLRDEVDALLANPLPRARDLKPRQLQAVQLLAMGFSEQDVSVQLRISRRTVEFHKYQAMERLGLSSSAELYAYLHEHGLGPA